MRAPSKQPLSYLADGIAAELGDRVSRAEILSQIESVRQQAERLDAGFRKALDKDSQRKARQAKRAILEFFPNGGAPAELWRWAMLADAKGPDKRLDVLQWLCAHAACVLVNEYGDGKPVTTPQGAAHSITQMLCEAITGEPPSDAACLRALRSVIAWRKPQP